MRLFIFRPFAAILTLISVFLIASFAPHPTSTSISLSAAIKNKSITATATSNGKYSGKSVDLMLTNNTQNSLQIIIPAGTKFLPADNGEQTLIQVEEQLVTLQPGGTYRGQIGAFCTESHDRCPTASSKFTIAQNTDPKFDRLFAYMKGKTISKGAYQDAVWAISDGKSISNIVTETPADVAFRKEVAVITGQRDTWFTSPQNVSVDERGNFNHETLRISGDLAFTCTPGTKVHQDIHKGNGDVFYASDRTMTAASGKVNYAFHLAVRGWEKGTYYIRIHDGSKELARYEFTV